MSTTITVPTPSIHWLLYPLLVGGLLFGLYLWHDTEVKDTVAIQAVATAKTSQTTVDKQVSLEDQNAQQTLKAKNDILQTQLAAAKTEAQQVALINKASGTNIQKAQAIIPSSPSVVSPVVPYYSLSESDATKLSKQAVDFQEAENQIAADKIEIAGDAQRLSAADDTIESQNTEITALKGGSRFHRFLKGTEHVAVGVGVGIVVGYAIHK